MPAVSLLISTLIALVLLVIGAILIGISLVKPVAPQGRDALRFSVPPGRDNRSWLFSGGLLIALGGAVILLISRYHSA